MGRVGTRPFTLLDRLGSAGAALSQAAATDVSNELKEEIENTLRFQFGPEYHKMAGIAKLMRNYALVYAGLLVGSLTNSVIYRDNGGAERQYISQ